MQLSLPLESHYKIGCIMHATDCRTYKTTTGTLLCVFPANEVPDKALVAKYFGKYSFMYDKSPVTRMILQKANGDIVAIPFNLSKWRYCCEHR